MEYFVNSNNLRTFAPAFRRNRWREEELPAMLRWNDKQQLIIKQNGFN